MRRDKQYNVLARLCTKKDVNLPEDGVDVVFLCDVYRYLDFPADTMAGIHAALHDEGILVVVAFVPLHWAWLAAAFILFRLFDILKPWPIRRIEKRIGGGLGIMLDDIVAALYALAILQGTAFLLQSM